MRIFRLLLIITTLTFFGCSLFSVKKATLPTYSVSQNFEEVGKFPIVRLHDKNGEFFCSGTVISDDYVLTAAHCLVDDKDELSKEVIQITAEDGTVYPSKAIKRNSPSDLGLVQGNFKDFYKVRIMLRPNEMDKFEGKLAACGYPRGASLVCYGLDQPQIYVDHIAAKGLLFAGMSGGPVIEATSMTIIAVNTAVGNGFVLVSPLVGLFEMFKIKVVP